MTRVLLKKQGCHFCNDAMRVINRLNLKLPLNKQIKIVDGSEWEEFGVRSKPIMDVLEDKGFNYYPFLIVDGIIVAPAPTPQILYTYLSKLLEEDFVI